MGDVVSSGVDHDDLVDKLMSGDYVKSQNVELVFRAVDRGFYFLPDHLDQAYKDLAWKKGNLHLSAPSIYGEVMENLQIKPGLSFLNLGSGTGYLSTMVGLLLGPYGINHGVELHADVIDYAYSKLNQFKLESPALDCFEFCEPVFINGNSLSLTSDCRQYDRVYCGAACPKNHENYIKNLLKIGGILVMPLNEKLMQIVRKSETEWESKTVLPVSFSTLQSPSPNEKSLINLPDVVPLRLDEACRAVIRSVLRKRALEENPNLCVRHRTSRPKNDSKMDLLPDIIVPMMNSNESLSADISFVSRRINTVADLARTIASAEVFLSRTRRRRADRPPKREKFDSGVVLVDSTDSSGSEGSTSPRRSHRLFSSSPSQHQHQTDSSNSSPGRTQLDSSLSHQTQGVVTGSTHVRAQPTSPCSIPRLSSSSISSKEATPDWASDHSSMDICDSNSDLDVIAPKQSKKDHLPHQCTPQLDSSHSHQTQGVVTGSKHVRAQSTSPCSAPRLSSSSISSKEATPDWASDHSSMDICDSDSDLDVVAPKQSKKDHIPPQCTPLYSTVMREKLLLLPLPPALKAYLNYYREF